MIFRKAQLYNESFYIKVECEKIYFSSRLQFHACLNPCFIIVKDKHLYISTASLCTIVHVAAGRLGGDFRSTTVNHSAIRSTGKKNHNYISTVITAIRSKKKTPISHVSSLTLKIKITTESPNSEIQYFQNLMLFNPCSFYTIQKSGVKVWSFFSPF